MLMDMTPAEGLPAYPAVAGAGPIVCQEATWFASRTERSDGRAQVWASRWVGFANEAREETSVIPTDGPVLGVALRAMDITVFAAEKLIHDGHLRQGMMRVNEAGQPIRGIFRGDYDLLHLHIPNAVIADCLDAEYGGCGTRKPCLVSAQPASDPVIERLARALIRADDVGGRFGRCYAEGIGLAIVARLLGKSADRRHSTPGPRVAALSKWRLKRAVDYIAAHLGEPIGLGEMAASTGLTRMHFAAQFRAATGLRPHEYLVRKRIERARELLASSALPLVDVAFEVGFATQSHFTTVFTAYRGKHTESLAARELGGRADSTIPEGAIEPVASLAK